MAGSYKRKDHLYHEAKREGFRSRAAYKLQELQRETGLIKQGFKVIDLGAWPGGWMQVAKRLCGQRGLVVGIDLKEIEDFGVKNIKAITADVRDEQALQEALSFAGSPFDVVLSDMSPKLSGIKEVDQLGSVGCAELALWAAGTVLKPGGTFVVKLFKGNESEQFVKATRPVFNKLIRKELKSTRKTSNEFYAIGFGFRGLAE